MLFQHQGVENKAFVWKWSTLLLLQLTFNIINRNKLKMIFSFTFSNAVFDNLFQ